MRMAASRGRPCAPPAPGRGLRQTGAPPSAGRAPEQSTPPHARNAVPRRARTRPDGYCISALDDPRLVEELGGHGLGVLLVELNPRDERDDRLLRERGVHLVQRV